MKNKRKVIKGETTTCSYCGTVNSKGNTYCEQCMNPLRPIKKPIS